MTTTTQELETVTEVELDLENYTIIAEVLVIYEHTDCTERHPYGDGYATHYYTEIDVDSVQIQNHYKCFDVAEGIKAYIEEDGKYYYGTEGLYKDEVKKLERLAVTQVSDQVL